MSRSPNSISRTDTQISSRTGQQLHSGPGSSGSSADYQIESPRGRARRVSAQSPPRCRPSSSSGSSTNQFARPRNSSSSEPSSSSSRSPPRPKQDIASRHARFSTADRTANTNTPPALASVPAHPAACIKPPPVTVASPLLSPHPRPYTQAYNSHSYLSSPSTPTPRRTHSPATPTPRSPLTSTQSSPRTPSRRLPSSLFLTAQHPRTSTPPPLTKAKATLAMSIQVPRTPESHCERGRRDAKNPRLRGRSESRSERLLRDTLRRAEEAERARMPASPSPSKFRITPIPTPACECEQDWALFRAPEEGRPGMVRNWTYGVEKERERNHSRKPSASSAYSFSSADHHQGATSPRLTRSPTSPVLGRERETPHGAVLRSRLEGVLRGAEWDSQSQSSKPHLPTPAHSPGSPPTPPSDGGLVSPSARSREKQVYHSPTSTSPRGPLTPPPTPPTYPHTPTRTQSSPYFSQLSQQSTVPTFDARHAAEQCKQMTGLVSFCNVEGLGCPEEEGEEEGERGGRWGRVGRLIWGEGR